MVRSLIEKANIFLVIKNKEVVYDEVTILKWSAEAASGLTFLHANGITHRDVKPDK